MSKYAKVYNRAWYVNVNYSLYYSCHNFSLTGGTQAVWNVDWNSVQKSGPEKEIWGKKLRESSSHWTMFLNPYSVSEIPRSIRKCLLSPTPGRSHIQWEHREIEVVGGITCSIRCPEWVARMRRCLNIQDFQIKFIIFLTWLTLYAGSVILRLLMKV